MLRVSALLRAAAARPPALLAHRPSFAPQIMSLIDTLCLGRMASVLELAALGPASL